MTVSVYKGNVSKTIKLIVFVKKPQLKIIVSINPIKGGRGENRDVLIDYNYEWTYLILINVFFTNRNMQTQ